MLTRSERNAHALPVQTLPSGGFVEFEGFERITALKKMVESEGVPTVDVADLMKVWKGSYLSLRESGCYRYSRIREGLQSRSWLRASLLVLMALDSGNDAS